MAQGTQDALPDLAKLEIKSGEKLLKSVIPLEKLYRLNVIKVENSQFRGCGKALRTTKQVMFKDTQFNSAERVSEGSVGELETLSSGQVGCPESQTLETS